MKQPGNILGLFSKAEMDNAVPPNYVNTNTARKVASAARSLSFLSFKETNFFETVTQVFLKKERQIKVIKYRSERSDKFAVNCTVLEVILSSVLHFLQFMHNEQGYCNIIIKSYSRNKTSSYLQ